MSKYWSHASRLRARERAFRQWNGPVEERLDDYSPLRQRRVARKVTQRELGERTYLHANAIAALEQGRWKPRAANARRVARALNVSVDQLWPNAAS